MAVTHLLPIEKFPCTQCGVNIQEKNVQWVADDEDGYADQVTCSNCRKLLEGGHMGGPVPRTTPEERAAKAEKSEREKTLDKHHGRLFDIDVMRKRIQGLNTDMGFQLTKAMSPEERREIEYCREHLEAADSKLEFAKAEASTALEEFISQGKENE